MSFSEKCLYTDQAVLAAINRAPSTSDQELRASAKEILTTLLTSNNVSFEDAEQEILLDAKMGLYSFYRRPAKADQAKQA